MKKPRRYNWTHSERWMVHALTIQLRSEPRRFDQPRTLHGMREPSATERSLMRARTELAAKRFSVCDPKELQRNRRLEALHANLRFHVEERARRIERSTLFQRYQPHASELNNAMALAAVGFGGKSADEAARMYRLQPRAAA